MLYLERINRLIRSIDVLVLYVRVKIACLVSLSIITKMVLNLKNNESFLIKFIEMKFHSYLEIESCLINL